MPRIYLIYNIYSHIKLVMWKQFWDSKRPNAQSARARKPVDVNEWARAQGYSGSQLCADLQTHHPASCLRRAVLLKCNPFCVVTAKEFNPAADRALCHRFSSHCMCVFCPISLRPSSEWVTEWMRESTLMISSKAGAAAVHAHLS